MMNPTAEPDDPFLQFPSSQVMTKTPAPESNDDPNSVIDIETLCGRVLKVHVHAPALTLLELRVCIEDQLGFTPEFNKMLVNHRELSETDIVQVSQMFRFFTRTFKENVKCLCGTAIYWNIGNILKITVIRCSSTLKFV
jgi:hypothetical protein